MSHNPVTLELITREQAPVIANLFELYVHDFTEHLRVPLQPSGRFEVPLDEAWWTSSDHFAFLVRHCSELAGFALARRGSRVSGDIEVMDVAEFFVARGLRRQGVGMAAAHALFARFPARWEMRVRQSNGGARSFWTRAAAAWLGHDAELAPFTAQGIAWQVVRLDSAKGSGR